MSANLNELIAQIPQDKIAEIVNGLAANATAQQVKEALATAGVEATEGQAQALLESLYGSDDEGREVSDLDLESVAGGFFTSIHRGGRMIPDTDENGNQLHDYLGRPIWRARCRVCGQ